MRECAAQTDPLPVLAPLSAVGVTEGEVSVVLPADYPLASRSGLRLADLADARWIEAPDVAPALADIRRAADTDGFRAAFRYDGTDTLPLVRLAAAGLGLTLLPMTVTSAVRGMGRQAARSRLSKSAHCGSCTGLSRCTSRLPAGSPAAVFAAVLARGGRSEFS
jgi:hypothetical protein